MAGRLEKARVDQIDPGGMALAVNGGPGGRYWVNWPLLGLSEAEMHGVAILPVFFFGFVGLDHSDSIVSPKMNNKPPNYYTLHYTTIYYANRGGYCNCLLGI